MSEEGPRRLRRSRDHKIAGVAAGIAEYLELDPTIVRLAFVVIALLGLGGMAVAYVVLWLIMPAPEAREVEAEPARVSGPPSKALLAVIAVVLVLSVAGGIASLGALSAQLLRISLPIWIVVIVGAYLLMRSRSTRTS